MPIHKTHLRALHRGLQNHEQRLETLKAQRSLVDDEIGAHELILKLGRSQKVLALLNSTAPMHSDTLLNDLDVNTPPESKVELVRSDSGVKEARLRTRVGSYHFSVSWNERKGFSVNVEDSE